MSFPLPTVSQQIKRRIWYVDDYGADPTGVSDSTAAVRAARAAAIAKGGGEVRFVAGTYLAAGIEMVHGVVYAGPSPTKERCVIKPPPGSAEKGVFVLTQAWSPALYAGIKDLALVGNGNAGQHAIYLKATPIAAPPYHGGLWYSELKRLSISGFDGHCIWLQGGPDSSLLPHQFLRIIQVVAEHSGTWDSLRMTGQVGQVVIEGGVFFGPNLSVGDYATNPGGHSVYVDREMNDAGVLTGNARNAYDLTFLQVNMGACKTPIVVKGATNVNFIGCNIEPAGQCFTIQDAAKVNISGTDFLNAGHIIGGGGWLVRAEGATTVVSLRDSTIAGAADSTYQTDGVASLVTPLNVTDNHDWSGRNRFDKAIVRGQAQVPVTAAAATIYAWANNNDFSDESQPALVLVSGTSSADATVSFADLVLLVSSTNVGRSKAFVVVSSLNSGYTGARTYSQDAAGNLKLALPSGNCNVRATVVHGYAPAR